MSNISSEKVKAAIFVTLTSLGAVLITFLTACASIMLTLTLKAILNFIILIISTIGEVGLATVAAIASGFTISLTVILSACTSAITFPPSLLQARLAVAIAVSTSSITSSAVALFVMTSLRVDVELGVAVVTTAAVAVAFASVWAVGVMSLVEKETHQVGLKVTSLVQAVRHNKHHVLNLLVRLPFGSQKEETQIALLYAVKAGFIECARVLINAGADPNIKDAYNNTPLISACQLGSTALVRMILGAGALVDFRNSNGETALHHATKCSHVECTRILLEKGADVNAQDCLWRTPLMLSVRHARKPIDIIRLLIDAKCDINMIGNDNRTVAHYAAIRGINFLESGLLDNGVDVGVQDAEGNTPLHLAALEGNFLVVKTLLECGCGVDTPNYMRRTALHLAASRGCIESIELLLSNAADPMMADNAGHFPVNHAVMSNKQEATVYFLKHNCFPCAVEGMRLDINVQGVPAINPLRIAVDRCRYHLARFMVLSGCDTEPLRQRHLLARRRGYLEDIQILHLIWLQACLFEPWSLQDLSRLVIRRHLVRPAEDLLVLPLPSQIRQFLMFRDLEEELLIP